MALTRKRPRSSWEASGYANEVIAREDVSLSDIYQIDDDWTGPLRQELGLESRFCGNVQKRVENPERPFSTVEKPVDTVHRICNENPNLTRPQQIDLCVKAGINIHTARTQQSKWAVARKR
jgi:hypothetical protein